MNTGLPQELALFEAIKRDLRKKRFGLIPECCRVYHHRAYFSRDRKADIIVDIAVEVSLPGSSQPFFIWVWESKDYVSPLSVGHVEEFHAKLQQIGADKTKGTIALSGLIQRAALTYAASKGIGVAKFLPGNSICWLQFSREDIPADVARARFVEDTFQSMTEPGFTSINRGFYAYTPDGKPFSGGFEQFLQRGFVDVLNRNIWRSDIKGWHWRREWEAGHNKA
jgi:hypothetical protein